MNFKLKLEELFGVDLRSLALFRICLGFLIIIDLFDRASELIAFYTDDGIFPRTYLINKYSNYYNLSLHLINGSVFFQTVLFLLAGLFAVALVVGFRTRLATFFSWFLMLSLHVRNPIILIGGDELLRMLLFWSMFLPLGARCSIDSVLCPSSVKPPTRILSMGTVAVLFQVVILYLISIAFKTKAPEWLDGSAIYFALTQEHYAKPLATYLLNFPDFLKYSTIGVYWFEIIGPLLLFIPFFTGPIRTLIVILFISFQLGMGLCIDLSIFPWASSIAMIPFLPGWFWEKFFKAYKAPENINKYFTKSLLFFERITPSLGSKPVNVTLSKKGNFLAAIFLIYILVWNLETVDPEFKVPKYFKPVGYALRLDQWWSLYSPLAKVGYWYVIPGTLKDGIQINLFRYGKPVSWEKPDFSSTLFKNRQWQALLLHVAWNDDAKYTFLPALSWYFCKSWNEKHVGKNQLEKVQIYLVYNQHFPDGSSSGPKEQLLWTYDCVKNN